MKNTDTAAFFTYLLKDKRYFLALISGAIILDFLLDWVEGKLRRYWKPLFDIMC